MIQMDIVFYSVVYLVRWYCQKFEWVFFHLVHNSHVHYNTLLWFTIKRGRPSWSIIFSGSDGSETTASPRHPFPSAISYAFTTKVAGDWLSVSWVSVCVAWVERESKINLSFLLSWKSAKDGIFLLICASVLCSGIHIHQRWQFNSPFIRL